MPRQRTVGAVSGSTATGVLEVGSRMLASARVDTLVRIFAYKMGFALRTILTSNGAFWAGVTLVKTDAAAARTSENVQPIQTGLTGATDLRGQLVIDYWRTALHVMTDSGVGNPMADESGWAYTDLLVPAVQMRAILLASTQTLVWDMFAVLEWERVRVTRHVHMEALHAAGMDADELESHLQSS